MASQGLKSDFEDQSWLHVARRAYRFAEHPIGCLSTKAKFCLCCYTILLLPALWAVR
jgi:hypothetical protein